MAAEPAPVVHPLCVPKTISVLIGRGNHLTSAHNDRAPNCCAPAPGGCLAPANVCREPAVGRTAHHGELLKVGFEVAQSSVAKYKRSEPPSQGWDTVPHAGD
jgi:hypothetical protein